MFKRVIAAILGIASTLNLGLSPEKLREAILAALETAKSAATLSPAIWDDLVISLAIGMVKSPAWDLILQLIRQRFDVPVGAGEVVAAAGPEDHLLTMLEDEFNLVKNATV